MNGDNARKNGIGVPDRASRGDGELCLVCGLPRARFSRLDDGELDDTFIEGVESVHLEMMSEKNLWIGVYLTNGERFCFNARGERGISYEVTEWTAYTDFAPALQGAPQSETAARSLPSQPEGVVIEGELTDLWCSRHFVGVKVAHKEDGFDLDKWPNDGTPVVVTITPKETKPRTRRRRDDANHDEV